MKLVVSTLGAMFVLAGCATGPGTSHHAPYHHAAHHPSRAAAAAPATAGQMDAMMKSMHEMHARIAAVKSPEERAALMNDHMKLMRDGMALMGRMRDGQAGMGMHGTTMGPEMMGRRLEMMEMMMQMMVDREAMRPPATR